MPAAGQTTSDSRIEEARRLRDRGDLGRAADRLRAFLQDHPDDASALRLLADVLERAGQTAGARRALQDALRFRPDDPLLRLDYGRILVDRAETEAAREALGPVAEGRGVPPRIRADALVHLGRAALRDGAVDDAEELLRRALEFEARHQAALRLLRSLHRTRSSWIGTRGAAGGDDQPVRRAGAEVRADWRVRRWLAAGLLAATERVSAVAPTATLDRAGVGTRVRWEPLNVEASLRGGGYRRSGGASVQWTAGGSLEVTGPGAVAFRLEAEREPYLFTAASVEDALDVVSWRGVIERPEADGWSGRLSYREDRFEDNNRLRETTARILAPVTTTPAGSVRLGYRFHAADADRNAYGPLEGAQGRLLGRYDPVYTPEDLRSHSVLMELAHGREGAIRITGEAAWGFHAREERPVLFSAVPGSPDAGTDLQFRRRAFTPWHLVARVELPILPAMELELDVGHEKSAFRSRSFVELGWTYYLIPSALR